MKDRNIYIVVNLLLLDSDKMCDAEALERITIRMYEVGRERKRRERRLGPYAPEIKA